RTVCYNYIPIVDWTRTDLAYPLKSGLALRFDMVDFVAWDVFALKRPKAADSYDAALVEEAEARFKAMPKERPAEIETIILAGLPGSDFSYDRTKILELLATFAGWTKADMQASLAEFLAEVAPVADEFGIRLGIHPDDPPYDLFGLPRIVSNAADARALIERTPDPANGLTFC